MKKSSSSSHSLGSFPSPGAPKYRDHKGLGSQKGWSSERIPKPAGSSIRRHTMAGLTPFSGGRTMPSKWDEAERWICSPISAHADSRVSSRAQLQQRRPKSISGSIVPPTVAYYYSNYSPTVTVPLCQGLVVRNLMVGSPFSTGVLAPVAVSLHHFDPHDDDDVVFGYDAAGNGMQQYSYSHVLNENGLYDAPLCAEQPCNPCSPISQDEKHDGIKNKDTVILSRCDKGTQMSTSESENDAHSSPESSANSVKVQLDCHSPKLVVRDVQVDSQASFIMGSKRHASQLTKTDSLHSKDFREHSTQAQSSSWDVEESTSDISKLHREEAKIIAWENLQKAKAEAAIRKLEMKLEKKRSSSMDKILSKLRKAQMKAENMRSLTPLQQDHRVSKTCNVFSFSKYAQIWSPISCFSNHSQ